MLTPTDLLHEVIYNNEPCYCYDSIGGKLIKILPVGSRVGTVLATLQDKHWFSENVLYLAVDNKLVKEVGAFYVTYQPSGFTNNGQPVILDPSEVQKVLSQHDITANAQSAATSLFDSFKDFFTSLNLALKWLVAGLVAVAVIYIFNSFSKRK